MISANIKRKSLFDVNFFIILPAKHKNLIGIGWMKSGANSVPLRMVDDHELYPISLIYVPSVFDRRIAQFFIPKNKTVVYIAASAVNKHGPSVRRTGTSRKTTRSFGFFVFDPHFNGIFLVKIPLIQFVGTAFPSHHSFLSFVVQKTLHFSVEFGFNFYRRRLFPVQRIVKYGS